MKPDVRDAIAGVGIVFLAVGSWLIYVPAAFVTVGLFLVYLAVWHRPPEPKAD